jgi:hypothetical protein
MRAILALELCELCAGLVEAAAAPIASAAVASRAGARASRATDHQVGERRISCDSRRDRTPGRRAGFRRSIRC